MNDKQFNILRWTPAAISAALLILIVLVSIRNVSQMRTATYWREHTFKVILDAQALEDKLLDAQSGVDHYASTGAPNLLVEYRNDTNDEARDFNELSSLTRDNAEQQRRLRELSSAIKAVFQYDRRVIAIYGQQGAQAAGQADSGAQERQILDPAVKDVEKFEEGEKALLAQRDSTEQADYHQAARLLILGSVLAATLLLFSNFFASREMGRRRRAEIKQRELIDDLQKSLTEVKTLSGLIPICGWCKNVRSDTGYWHSVEHYVRAHTDATFTHSMCPACAEKWKDELVKGNSESAAA
ncbi:MAG TPA: CHASE3 domain-containing protein [Verrucomicrobiae bacterium]|jgi:CHASE3 domain sensor protein|nr:CHASE3 domain-containing protein [Verrucomicrobiae bacterium]